jgi:hypothetical protein
MRLLNAFDHKNLMPGAELCPNPKIWIVASGFVLCVTISRSFLLYFILQGG